MVIVADETMIVVIRSGAGWIVNLIHTVSSWDKQVMWCRDSKYRKNIRYFT